MLIEPKQEFEGESTYQLYLWKMVKSYQQKRERNQQRPYHFLSCCAESLDN